MGSASGAIASALAVRFLPDPTHLIYLALIGALAQQAVACLIITTARVPAAPRARVAAGRAEGAGTVRNKFDYHERSRVLRSEPPSGLPGRAADGGLERVS